MEVWKVKDKEMEIIVQYDLFVYSSTSCTSYQASLMFYEWPVMQNNITVNI